MGGNCRGVPSSTKSIPNSISICGLNGSGSQSGSTEPNCFINWSLNLSSSKFTCKPFLVDFKISLASLLDGEISFILKLFPFKTLVRNTDNFILYFPTLNPLSFKASAKLIFTSSVRLSLSLFTI